MKKLLSTLLFLLVAGLALAAPRPFPQESSDVKADPAIRFGKLPNGMRYAILANKEPKGRAALRLLVEAGSFNEKDSQRGLAHFLEHMSFNGSANFPAGTLIEYFQRLGMNYGGDTNAMTSFDSTIYMIDLPNTKPEALVEGMKVLSDYSSGLLLEAKEIEKERGVILSEKRSRDSVQYRTLVADFGFHYGQTLLPTRLPIGTEEVISKSTREDFLDFYNTWYRPERIVIVAVGDFDPTLVEEQITKSLGAAKDRAEDRKDPDVGKLAEFQGLLASFHAEKEAPSTRISLSTVVPFKPEPDSKKNRLKDLPRSIAEMMLNRRFSILAKQEGAPFLGAGVSVSDMYKAIRRSSVTVVCKPEQWQAALGVGEQELRRALQFGFQAAELKEARANMLNALEQAAKGASTRRSSDLAMQLVQSIREDEVFTTPAEDLALFKGALEALTPEACQAALLEVFNIPHRYLFVTGNLEIPGDAKAVIKSTFENSAKVALKAPAKIADEAFAYTQFGKAGEIVQRSEIKDLEITQVQFANGVRLNLKKTDFEASRIRLQVRLGDGSILQPKDMPGLSFFISNAFNLGGLGKHSIDDLQRILAGKTVGSSLRVDTDAIVLQGQTNREDLQLQLQLMTAQISDPGYRPEAMRLISKGLVQFYNQLEHTFQGALSMDIPSILSSGDSRFGIPAREVFMKRNMEEAKAWLSQPLKQGALEIAVVGDIDIEKTIQAVASTFGTLPARSPRATLEAERIVKIPETPVSKEFLFDSAIPKGSVCLYWPTTDDSDIKRSRRLNMLCEVFNDRLRVKVREELGDAYSPNASVNLSDTFKDYGMLMVQVIVDPAQAKRVADVIAAIADDIATKGVSEDEVQRAKLPVLTSQRESLRKNEYWLGRVLARAQEKPEVLDWSRNRIPDTESITKADLDALAKQYLPSKRAFRFSILPKPAAAPAPAVPAGK
jgi:zinc protease